MNINVAILAFEYLHSVEALKLAISKFKNEKIFINPSIWTARDGIKSKVNNLFPECKFLDAGKGWHGYFRKPLECYELIKLTELEKKHFSYTHSRLSFFRDPARFNKNDIKIYTEITNYCYTLLKTNNVQLCFFISMPHTLLDLGFLYAAQRLEIKILIRGGPYIGDFNYPVLMNNNINISASYPVSNTLIHDFKVEFNRRNLKINIEEPSYMENPNTNMPSIPEPESIFFHKSLIQKIYSITKNKSLSIFADKVFFKLKKYYCIVYIKLIKKLFVTKEDSVIGKDYILVLLQYHPEQTTSTSALDTPFEDERVLNLAQKYPDKLILVREHPGNIRRTEINQYRSIRALRELSKLKNVRYLFPDSREKYLQILEKALFTVSTSGTVALESIQLGVPSIHFSNSFAKGFPGIVVVSSVDEIDIEDITLEKNNLNNMSLNDLIDGCLNAMTERPMEEGFITGYHNKVYTSNEYLTGASNIIFSCLNYALSAYFPKPRLANNR